MNMLKAVSFDAFGTLIIPKVNVGEKYADFLRHFCGIIVHENVIEKSFVQMYKQYLVKWPNFGKMDGIPACVWWQNLMLDTYRNCLHEPSDLTKLQLLNLQKCSDLFDWYASDEAWSLRSGTLKSLDSLQPHYKLSVLSNFDERLPAILKSVGISHRFSAIVYSNQFDFMKPDMRIFKVLLDQLNIVQPDHLLHIGDCPIRDYEAARKVGLLSLLLAQDKSIEFYQPSHNVDVPANHVVKDLSSIKYVIDNIPLKC